MARYAVARVTDGLVVNVVEWDGGPQWAPPPGHLAIASAVAGPGDRWDGSVFIKIPHVPSADEIEDQTMPPLVSTAIAFRDRADYLPEPSLAALPALSSAASATQTRDYIIANVIPRLNVLSAGSNTAIPRINVNTKASQGVIKVLLYLAKRLMGLS